jgi:hypothetical protein
MFIPHFIKVRGCINCESSKEHKKRTGHDYGFDHELMARCLLSSCFDNGHDLTKPYIDLEEIVNLYLAHKDTMSDEEKGNIKRYCDNCSVRYRKFYKEIGVDIKKIINKLND